MILVKLDLSIYLNKADRSSGKIVFMKLYEEFRLGEADSAFMSTA